MNAHIIEPTFETFHSRDYLETYYNKIGVENEMLLQFFAKAYVGVKKNARVLEFSGGPTIYSLITAAKYVREIYFSDYLESNLYEVKIWKDNEPNAFGWTAFFKRALEIEGAISVTQSTIDKRQNLLRKKLAGFLQCDAFKKHPLGAKFEGFFDIVNVNFVPESITSSKQEWFLIVKNICSLIKPKGMLIMSAIKEAVYYHVGRKKFPAVHIVEDDLLHIVRSYNFDENSILLESIPAEIEKEDAHGFVGYRGMMFLRAEKKN